MKVMLCFFDNKKVALLGRKEVEMVVLPRLGEFVDAEDFMPEVDGISSHDWEVKRICHKSQYIKVVLNPC